MVISGFQELKARLREAVPQRAVVAAAHDRHTLEAVFQAQRDGLIRPILVGDGEKIRAIARALGVELRAVHVSSEFLDACGSDPEGSGDREGDRAHPARSRARWDLCGCDPGTKPQTQLTFQC